MVKWKLYPHLQICASHCLSADVVATWAYHIVENFRRRKRLQIAGVKCRWEHFADCSLVLPKDAIPPKFCGENFRKYSHKSSKFVKVFSLWSFPLYGTFDFTCILQHHRSGKTIIVCYLFFFIGVTVKLVEKFVWVFLITGLEYRMERWNGKWNGIENVHNYS